MSELLIDVGNSAAKWAVFDGLNLNSKRHCGGFSELAEALWIAVADADAVWVASVRGCLLYTSPSPRDRTRSRMPSSA